jgi:hypothetical protein
MAMAFYFGSQASINSGITGAILASGQILAFLVVAQIT